MTVLRVIIPGDNRHGLLGLQHVGRRRVIEDHAVLWVAAQPRHVLGEHAIYVGAVLAEQSHRAKSARVHLVHQRLGILRQTCCENDQFVVLGHHFQKVLDSGPLLVEDLADLTLDVDRDDEVRVLDRVELGVHQSLVQIQHQSLHALGSLGLRPQHSVLVLFPAGIAAASIVAALGLRAVLGCLIVIHDGSLCHLALRHLRYHRFELLLEFCPKCQFRLTYLSILHPTWNGLRAVRVG